jgi:hypothetical protein
MAGWVELVIEALPYVYGAVSSYTQNKTQSKMEADAALSNSLAIRNSGDANVNAILAIGGINAKMAMAAAGAENQNRRALIDSNIRSKLFLSNYESTLLENEALLIGEAVELDVKQLERKHAKAIGSMRTSQAASGAIIDQDSPAQAVADAREQQELEKFIIRRGGDIQMQKLMDKAAFGRWEAGLEANSMAVEGRILETSNITGAFLRGFGITSQASIDAQVTGYNSGINAGQAYNTGMQKSDAYSNTAASSFWSGMFGAGTSAAKNYVKMKTENDATDSLLVDSRPSGDPGSWGTSYK